MIVEFPDGRSLEAALKAISHEADAGGRSIMRTSRKDNALRLDIEAQDVVALRAAANSCLRALQIFEKVEQNEEVQK